MPALRAMRPAAACMLLAPAAGGHVAMWPVALCQIVKLLFVDNLTQIRIVGFLRVCGGFGFLGQIVILSCRKNPPRFVVGF
jgi:hypothetical protein